MHAKSRPELVALATQILNAQDIGVDYAGLLEEFEQSVPYPNARELFAADYDAAYIAERAAAHRGLKPGDLDKDELLALVRKVRLFEGADVEVDIAEDQLRGALAHPELGRLLGDASMTDEEVVEAARSYQPVKL